MVATNPHFPPRPSSKVHNAESTKHQLIPVDCVSVSESVERGTNPLLDTAATRQAAQRQTQSKAATETDPKVLTGAVIPERQHARTDEEFDQEAGKSTKKRNCGGNRTSPDQGVTLFP